MTMSELFFMIFGGTDLRTGVSGAKFDAESDFDVRLAVAPQKPHQNGEKLISRSENLLEKNGISYTNPPER